LHGSLKNVTSLADRVYEEVAPMLC